MKAILRSSWPLLVLAAAATAGVAKADPNNPSDNDKAAARPFAIEGLRLAQAGNCREAVEQLERGEALVHAPTTAVPLAQCDIQLGKVIAGTEILNRVINAPLPPGAPASWADAKRQARGILDAAQPRVAKLRIHVDLPPGVQPNLEITVDGQPVPTVLLDNERPTDPGPHHVAAVQAGMGSAEADVTLADGQIRPVELRIAPGGGGAVVAAAPGTPDPYGQGGVVAVVPAPPSVSEPGTAWYAFEFGARLAFGLPFGGLIGGNGNDLNHTISNMFMPLWLDAGFRLASNWYVGSYFSYGITSLSNQFASGTCNQPGYGCSSSDIRLGVDASYHILPDGRFDPWFGLGFGYEWLSEGITSDATHQLVVGASTSGPNASLSAGQSGWEFVNVQAGLDFRLLQDTLGIGPFLSVAISQYTSQSNPSDFKGGTTGQSISNQALHEWFMFGARGDYDLKF
jgi:hypothetical protein